MNKPRILLQLCGAILICAAPLANAQTPQWIWTSKNGSASEERYFRKTFEDRDQIVEATLTASADARGELYFNGSKVGTIDDWAKPVTVNVTGKMVRGENVIAAHCTGGDKHRGLIVRLTLTQSTLGSAGTNYDPKQHAGLRAVRTLVSDKTWLASDSAPRDWTKAEFDDDKWKAATVIAKLGDRPWHDVFSPPQATAAETLEVEPGFKVELLHSATLNEGSWVAMTIDPKGRLIVSPQNETKLYRITLANGKFDQIETISQPVGAAMGLLCTSDALFVNGEGPDGRSLYRLPIQGDGFGAPVMIHKIEHSGGEHGSHAIELGPDKKLYVISGNFTKVPDDILASSPHKNYQDDQLLPRADDGNGFGAEIKPPGGFILRMNQDGSNCELFAAGSRNTYQIAFSPEGELFGFDSDMEWDWGTSWYRPIRINHWISGADFGFREGTGKFPEYYEDTLPSALNVGIGSPTGVKFGAGSRFPKPYRDAFFMLDWSYGRIFAAHLHPEGATYTATLETVVRGKPLNLTALEFGKDGAMYFITGGRNTESGLYRLSYVGHAPAEPAMTEEEKQAERAGREARRLRHDLEFFHGKRDPRIVDAVWPCLSNPDRWIRYAARIALEFQDVDLWKDRALNETNPDGGLTALMALARCGGRETQEQLFQALDKFSLSSLTEEQQLLKLRVMELSCTRQGKPKWDLAQHLIAQIDPLYPSDSLNMNRELCLLLLYFHAPDAISKTISLLDKAATQEEQTFYILHLRDIKGNWTRDEREAYFAWFDKDRSNIEHTPGLEQYFKDAGRDYSDGASFPNFLAHFRSDAITNMDDTEKTELASIIAEHTNAAAATVAPRKFVKSWTMEDVQPDLAEVKHGRSFTKGQAAFVAAQCVQCHRFGRSGGAIGPELTAVSSRLNSRDILESILEPSKVVSEQYQNTTFTLRNGDDVTGRVVDENDERLVVMTDPRQKTKVEVKKADIEKRRASKLSPMPDGLASILTKNEILDLIAYLESGGKRNAANFK
jgi:putative heme-binding domain-containing protein